MPEPTHHLAQLNLAHLKAPEDDPLVADFMNALDRVNGIGKRSPGFVWMMEGSGGPNSGNTDTKVSDDPLLISNLTVWEDIESFEAFVWNTVHRQFYARRHEWMQIQAQNNFVMWWIEPEHRPTIGEAMDRLAHLNDHGNSDHAFGWDYLPEAKLYKQHREAEHG